MTHLLEQLTAIVAVLAACFVGPGLAIGFLLWRKRQQRAEKRSPITKDLLRSPGHSLREQIDELADDIGVEVMALAVFPVLVLALYLAQDESERVTSASPALRIGTELPS